MYILNEDDYDDMLSKWVDLEAAVAILLLFPSDVEQFDLRVPQIVYWVDKLLKQNQDVSIYMLFQLANNSRSGYSAAHSLICVALYIILQSGSFNQNEFGYKTVDQLGLSMAYAMLTMNIAMTDLQNVLSRQLEPLSDCQQREVDNHCNKGAQLLRDLGIRDEFWLDIVAGHHRFSSGKYEPKNTIEEGMALISAVDRFGALVSPRRTRDGKTVVDAMQSLIGRGSVFMSKIGCRLINQLGIYPPGTFVELDDGRLAIVIERKIGHPHQPVVAIVTDPMGYGLDAPILHQPSTAKPEIAFAAASSRVNLSFNHARIFQLLNSTF